MSPAWNRAAALAAPSNNRTLGVLRINTALRHASEEGRSSGALRDIVSRNFTIVREDDIVFDVIRRIWGKGAVMALVVRGRGVPRPENVAGVITKEHVADSVASSISMYPTGD